MQSAVMPPASDRVTIVCCIEGGRLESQTTLMLESLRRWGGPLGQSRVLAVLPRRGHPLSAATLEVLCSLGVELHDGSRLNSKTWYNYYGKIVAVQLAEGLATTPVVVWLDGDTFIVGPLSEVALPHGEDFAGRRELVSPTVFDESGPDTEFWRRACEAVGVRWEDVPWLAADGPDLPQRLSFNSGIFAFRRGRGLADAYTDCMNRLLKSRLATKEGNFWVNEQHALTLAVVRKGLSFRELPRTEHHVVFDGMIDGPGASPSVADARVIHYSASMYPQHWSRLMERLRRERPELHRWLEPLGPIPEAKVPLQPVSLARKVFRNLRYRSFARNCIRVT